MVDWELGHWKSACPSISGLLHVNVSDRLSHLKRGGGLWMFISKFLLLENYAAIFFSFADPFHECSRANKGNSECSHDSSLSN